MPFKHRFVENEIKSFVHKIFSFYDKHVAVEEILKYLVDNNLEMSFPDREIRSFEDFRGWYTNVRQNYEWNIHWIEKIDVKVVNDGCYEVDLILRWEALTRSNREVVIHPHRQKWHLIDGEGEADPKIVRYQVMEFNQLPTPKLITI